MLRRVIGEDIRLRLALDETVGTILVDRSQLEQVVMNLAVNARDAMPHGGDLTIETGEADLDEAFAAERGADVRPGRDVTIAVSDTGTGMTEEVKSHLFEPFFTTKERGKGTGLGLSTVYGIVKQVGGHVAVYSEPGAGATFRVYFPRAERAPGPAPATPAAGTAERPRGAETILLVEDAPLVRDVARRILEKAGYVDAVVHRGILHAEVAFIEKPFSADALLAKVRETLGAPATAPAPALASGETR